MWIENTENYLVNMDKILFMRLIYHVEHAEQFYTIHAREKDDREFGFECCFGEFETEEEAEQEFERLKELLNGKQ